uniref:Uncharacterized protein n=1 Tax=Arundo donax TaxID=35708 RepID=A0A0A8ZLD6_ARUDO
MILQPSTDLHRYTFIIAFHMTTRQGFIPFGYSITISLFIWIV